VAGLVPLVLALQLDRTRHAWTSATTLVMLAWAFVLLALFALRNVRSAQPILDPSLFRERVFVVGNGALFLLGATFLNVLVFLPLYMVNVLGVSATRAGVSLIPLSLGVVFGATLAGQLASRLGRYRVLMLTGGAMLIAGLALLSRIGIDTSYTEVTLYMVVCGLGIGPALPLYTLVIQNTVAREKLGQATSASQFFRQIGGTVGVAFMGTVLATGLATGFAALPPAAAELVPAAQVAFEGVYPATGDAALSDAARAVFATSIATIYRIALLFAVAAWLVTWWLPEPS
jgi:predicted MFS family arabinose efflux permease